MARTRRARSMARRSIGKGGRERGRDRKNSRNREISKACLESIRRDGARSFTGGRDRGWASHLPVDCVGTLMHRLHATVEGGLPARTRHFAHARTRAKTAFPSSPWRSLLFLSFLSFFLFTEFEPISTIFGYSTGIHYRIGWYIRGNASNYFFPVSCNPLFLFANFFSQFSQSPIFNPSTLSKLLGYQFLKASQEHYSYGNGVRWMQFFPGKMADRECRG